MSRSNNGVRSKVTSHAQTPVGGRMGTERDEGGAPNQETANPKMEDMTSHHGPKGSSGTVKDMGGVGSYGIGADKDQKGYFEDKH